MLGLGLVFQGALQLQADALPGLIAALLGAAFFALSGVLVKRQASHLNAMQHTTGSLLFSLPLFAVTWFFLDGQAPFPISLKSGLAIGYLSVVGSVFGFMLYFYALQALGPTQVALIPLITPVLALALGHALEGEEITLTTLLGGGLILFALAMYQFAEKLYRRFRPRRMVLNAE